MKLLFSFLIFYFLFTSSVFAQTEIRPDVLPSPLYPSSSYPGFCIVNYEVLVNDNIYTCTRVNALGFYAVNDATNANTLKQLCWSRYVGDSSFQSLDGFVSGIVLSRKITSSFVMPSNFDSPCKLKSKTDPDEAQVCVQPIDVNRLVLGAFSNKFPLDLFTNFVSSGSVIACPFFTIRGQTFQLCYLNKLVASLKYVLLIIFIISSVIAL